MFLLLNLIKYFRNYIFVPILIIFKNSTTCFILGIIIIAEYLYFVGTFADSLDLNISNKGTKLAQKYFFW